MAAPKTLAKANAARTTTMKHAHDLAYGTARVTHAPSTLQVYDSAVASAPVKEQEIPAMLSVLTTEISTLTEMVHVLNQRLDSVYVQPPVVPADGPVVVDQANSSLGQAIRQQYLRVLELTLMVTDMSNRLGV